MLLHEVVLWLTLPVGSITCEPYDDLSLYGPAVRVDDHLCINIPLHVHLFYQNRDPNNSTTAETPKKYYRHLMGRSISTVTSKSPI
jgi:hypothetical protein